MSDLNPSSDRRIIKVGALARVEGEGALHVKMKQGRVEQVQLVIYEPPRFYEAFLRGRPYAEVPDITARICGICPIAYQMGSCHALEKCLGVFQQVTSEIRRLRNLIYCGEWIESHILHMFMLHLPDFLGYESAISLAQDHGPIVKQALQLKKLGNDLVALLGGRAVHPVGVCVGGFYRAPDREEIAALIPRVQSALEQMSELTLFLAQHVDYPDFERDYEFVSLQSDDEYPMNLGRIVSNKGLSVEQEEFLEAIEEKQVPHSTALHAVIKGRGAYLVGPLARLNLNPDKLLPRSAELLERVCQTLNNALPWRNNFLSLPARAIETVYALERALQLLQNHREPAISRIPIEPRAGVGGHGTEAPRGICWHQYRTDDAGNIATARIIPPTSQNQMVIEEDLHDLVNQLADKDDEELCLRSEHLIRNYDPCISCSVHFLKFDRQVVS